MKTNHLLFRYFISGISEALTENSDMWERPFVEVLPGHRPGDSANDNHAESPLKLHEYFNAAEQFLTSELFDPLKNGATEEGIAPSNQNIEDGLPPSEQISQIDIFLEKHGVFYHPARVEVALNNDSKRHFVLNTAISPQGLILIHREYALLQQINSSSHHQDLAQKSTPRVFGATSLFCRGMEIAFFIGEWFDGFHEFHLTAPSDSDSKGDTLHLWNSDGSVFPYISPVYFPIYEKASEILTTFYNISTFSQIFPWHHAAGDFIAKPTTEGFDVKLITVRGYAPIIAFETEIEEEDGGDRDAVEPIKNIFDAEDSTAQQEDIDKALLIFFLTLTIRMRIDRRDGTDEYCLLPSNVMDFILRGFFKALHCKTSRSFPKPGGLSQSFGAYLQHFSHENLSQIFEMIAQSGHPDNPETAFIKANLDDHVRTLSKKIQATGKNGFFIDKAS